VSQVLSILQYSSTFATKHFGQFWHFLPPNKKDETNLSKQMAETLIF